MHDSSTCPLCRRQPHPGSMSDDEFFAFVAACRKELSDKQERLLQRIEGADRWSFDLADGTLTVAAQRFGITAVGTHSSEYDTWLWAWANEHFPDSARASSRRLQTLHDLTGFRVFLGEGISASSADALDFTALAVHLLDAIGFFRCSSEGGLTLYLAVHEPP
jgi:hypothetical protein